MPATTVTVTVPWDSLVWSPSIGRYVSSVSPAAKVNVWVARSVPPGTKLPPDSDTVTFTSSSSVVEPPVRVSTHELPAGAGHRS